MTSAAVHGLKLLQLIRGENRSELALGVLVDRLELLKTLIACEACVGSKRRHLLLLGGEDRFELRGLILCQVEAFTDTLSRLVRIEAMVTAVLVGRLLLCGCGIIRRLRRGLLAEGSCSGKSKCQD